MLTEAHYGAVLNYFFFLLLDEAMAVSAAFKTVHAIQKKIKKNPEVKVELILINTMSSILKQYKDKPFISDGQPPHSEWTLADRENFSVWKQNIRNLNLHSAEALVLYYILKIPPNTISEGLGVPEGTVFYRLGKGIEVFSQGIFHE